LTRASKRCVISLGMRRRHMKVKIMALVCSLALHGMLVAGIYFSGM
jgi:hypothetical protein